MLDTKNRIASSCADELRSAISGRVALPGGELYDEGSRVWNGAVRHPPAIVAFCRQPDDVQAAVHAARRHGLRLSVRGGGHDWAGRALRDGGLVIDLTPMRDVAVDPQALVANVAGGARAKDVAVAAGAHGLVAAMGNCGTVGMAGLSLGGGYGPLSGTCGLAADNLLGAEIVLADGRRLTTGPDAEPDLFWALRGGGGNFGVVTSLRVRLHPVRDMLVGTIIYHWKDAGAVLRRYAAFAATAPDELGVSVGAMPGPDGEPVIMVVPLWNGDRSRGERAMEDVRAFGTPLSAQVGPATYADLLAQFDAWGGGRGRLPLGDPDALAARAHGGRCRRDHRGEGPRGVAALLGVLASLPRRRDAGGAGWRRVRPAPRALDGGDRRGLEARWG